MSDSILNTNGQNEIEKNRVFVGAKSDGEYVTGFTDKIFVIDLENLPDPLNPLNLPPNTIRVKFKSGYEPPATMGDTRTRVESYQDNVWDIEENNSWRSLFYQCYDLLEVLGANSSNVSDMEDLFGFCESLTHINIFDTSNVTDMDGMFHQCISLSTIPQFNTSKVTTMKALFSYCPSLISVPYLDTSNVTKMGWMFNNCTSLPSVPLFDTSNVTDMEYMFLDCYLLTTVPKFNTSNVTNMHSMLDNCTSLTSVPLFDTSNVTDMGSMLDNCTKVENGALALYQQASSQTIIPTNHYWAFHNCGKNTQTGAAELAQIPDDWK